jgi:ABC-type transport system involved in cytochrome c biogenesis, ATPase component
MNLYSLKKISHQIDGKLIFSDVSEEINSGEIVEIRGQNGSGKTTLLKIITGIINCKNIDSGNMTLDQVSYLGHKNGLIEEITLRQNFEILGMQVEKGLFKKFDLAQLKNQKIFNLSYGEKRKVALIRLISSGKNIWIMDEPFAGLDSKAIQELKGIISQHIKINGTVIMTNHQEEIPESKKIILRPKE